MQDTDVDTVKSLIEAKRNLKIKKDFIDNALKNVSDVKSITIVSALGQTTISERELLDRSSEDWVTFARINLEESSKFLAEKIQDLSLLLTEDYGVNVTE